MPKVIADITMSLDGYVTGPGADVEHDGPCPLKSRGEGEGDQLGLVAHLGQGDHEK